MPLEACKIRIGTDVYSMWLAPQASGEPVLATPFVLAPPSDSVFTEHVRPAMRDPSSLAYALNNEVASRVVTHAQMRHGITDVYLRHRVSYEDGFYVLHYPMPRDVARRISMNTLYCTSCGEHADLHQGEFCALHLGVGFTRPEVRGALQLSEICKFGQELVFWLGLQADSIYITAAEEARNAIRGKTEARAGDDAGRALDTGRDGRPSRGAQGNRARSGNSVPR